MSRRTRRWLVSGVALPGVVLLLGAAPAEAVAVAQEGNDEGNAGLWGLLGLVGLLGLLGLVRQGPRRDAANPLAGYPAANQPPVPHASTNPAARQAPGRADPTAPPTEPTRRSGQLYPTEDPEVPPNPPRRQV
ncbi:hypothetical protein SAMN05421810_103652 [Amycolatopsis arida]|uniref:MYXO-CTERM domain-containing protein n=1 Tax=Amycolatopsis arida TaxID=587909 RepID=A0A1I5TTX0_9PSEU|nr:hypothetical protein [Amycolatopsis arida]TDX95971.1 hypothetical protein CLV69_103105 [Amycolatopsis arida]SFP86428.1 hypothetical protein SAMN05421810_103652 [Amycolatopsis arida]